MSLAEKYCFDKRASIAFDRSNALWAKPKPILQTERENKSGNPKCPLFFGGAAIIDMIKVSRLLKEIFDNTKTARHKRLAVFAFLGYKGNPSFA